MPKEHDITVDLILQAAKKIPDFLKGYDLEEFLQDSKTQSAVIMQIVVIGELAKKLPDETKQQIDLPWRRITGFRDFAVHQYFGLDLKQVWDSASADAPIIREKLEDYLQKKQK